MAQTKTARQKISRLPRSIAKELEVNGDDAVLWLTKAGESKLAALEKNVKFKNARDDLSSLANAKWRITPDGNNITAASDYFKFSFRRRPQGGWSLRDAKMPMVVKNKTIGEYVAELDLIPHKKDRGMMPNLFIGTLPAEVARKFGIPEQMRAVAAYPRGIKSSVRNIGRICVSDDAFSYLPEEEALRAVSDALASPALFANLRKKPRAFQSQVGELLCMFEAGKKDSGIVLSYGKLTMSAQKKRRRE